MKVIVRNALSELGWNETFADALAKLDAAGDMCDVGRVQRIDRGWSTVLVAREKNVATSDDILREHRARNIGADVAVGDWVVLSKDGERVEQVVPRSSQLIRRAASDGPKVVPHVIAANIDVVFLVHAVNARPNQRRLERELVLAFDSGAKPVIVLTKSDATASDTARENTAAVSATALGVPVHVVSSVTGEGLEALLIYAARGETLAVLGASGVGKSTLVNALTGTDSQQTGAIRRGDQRGRHTTTAVDLVPLPERGWLVDTPGLRAIGLWSSGHGIERAFADIFTLADHCRFRDCKHEREPSCSVQQAIAEGRLDARRLEAMRRLVAEEAALEAEQRRSRRS